MAQTRILKETWITETGRNLPSRIMKLIGTNEYALKVSLKINCILLTVKFFLLSSIWWWFIYLFSTSLDSRSLEYMIKHAYQGITAGLWGFTRRAVYLLGINSPTIDTLFICPENAISLACSYVLSSYLAVVTIHFILKCSQNILRLHLRNYFLSSSFSILSQWLQKWLGRRNWLWMTVGACLDPLLNK